MFERLQKPFLTVETGEAYQPIRITYDLHQKEQIIDIIKSIKCLEQKQENSWNWFWKDECDELHFESIDSYKKSTTTPVRLATITIRDDKLYINLPSFKRACLAVPFFHRLIDKKIADIHQADFINKVFGLTERLPHGFTELFDEDELERLVHDRLEEYEKVQERCENAATAEEAFAILSEYTKKEGSKKLPYAERYSFQHGLGDDIDPDVVFLGFYIFLRGRELVAIRRWFGETGFTLANAAEETVQKVFGNMDIDIIE